jgi:hypothetical protein
MFVTGVSMLFFWRLPALPFTVVQSLFEPSTHCAFQYIYNIRYLQNYYMRQTHRVREAAPQSKIPSIREGFFRTFLRGWLELPLNAQQIVNGVQNGILPLHIILHPEHTLRFARVQRSDRPEGRFFSRDRWQAVLELRPLLSEQLRRLYPRKGARGQDEAFGLLGGRKFQREHVGLRYIADVDVRRWPAQRRLEPAHGASWLAIDERIDESIRAGRG